jgi:hypothetical protein
MLMMIVMIAMMMMIVMIMIVMIMISDDDNSKERLIQCKLIVTATTQLAATRRQLNNLSGISFESLNWREERVSSFPSSTTTNTTVSFNPFIE